MADTSLTDFLGAWAAAINDKINVGGGGMELEEELAALSALSPATYRIPTVSSTTFCDGKYTVKIQSSSNGADIISTSGGANISTIEIYKSWEDYSRISSMYIAKIDETLGLSIIGGVKNDKLWILLLPFTVADSTGELTTYIYNRRRENWGSIVLELYDDDFAVYRNFYDQNRIEIYFKSYLTSNQYDDLYYQYNVCGYTFDRTVPNITRNYTLYTGQLFFGTDRRNQTCLAEEPAATFYSFDYEISGRNVSVAKKSPATVHLFPHTKASFNANAGATSTTRESIVIPSWDGSNSYGLATISSWPTDDGSLISGFYWTKDKATCYVLAFKEGTYTLQRGWHNSCFSVWRLSGASLVKTTLTLDDIIHDIL